MNPPSFSSSPPTFRRTLGAVAASALIFPGLGQLMQGRIGAAVGFCLSALAAVSAFFWAAAVILIRYYGLMLDNGPDDSRPAPTVARMLIPLLLSFAVAMFLYLWNVLDVWLASRRAERAARDQAHQQLCQTEVGSTDDHP